MKNVAIITGASSGIGKEFARIHAKKGDLIIIARREDRLIKLKEELESLHNITVMPIVKNLTKPSSPKEVFDMVKNFDIRYLINNAGFGGQGKFHERNWDEDLAMIQLNIIALTELTRLFLPIFVKKDSGRILNVSSIASLMPGPLQAVYYATKAYISSFSNALSEELHDTAVSVTTLLPGATETEFASVSGTEKTALFNKAFSAHHVAKAGYNAMMNGKLNTIVGVTPIQRVSLLMLPLVPPKKILKQVYKMQKIKNLK